MNSLSNIFGIDQAITEVKSNIETALSNMTKAGYRVGNGCRFELYKDKFFENYLNAIITREYGNSYKIAQKELLYGYKDYWEFVDIANSQIILNCSNSRTRTEISKILKGGILEERDSTAWNYQFQYYLSSWFDQSGYKVTLEEPDFTFKHKGKEYSVAAKRLNSVGNLSGIIKNAENQIKLKNNYGFIALSLDKIHNEHNTDILRVDDPNKSIRDAEDIINTIIRNNFKSENFTELSEQVLGIIASVSFPYYLDSKKPIYELGYTSYLSFLPIKPPDSPEWNEAIDIQNNIRRARLV